MPRRYRPHEVIRVLEHFGWRAVRQRGSHVIMTREGHPGLVPVPASQREVRIGTFAEILRQARITKGEFESAAEEVLYMPLKKFTVFLLPDEDAYQVVFPHYPNCITQGESIEEALANAKEAIELLLDYEAEQGADPIPHNAHVSHVVVGEIEAEVPESLIEAEEEVSRTVG